LVTKSIVSGGLRRRNADEYGEGSAGALHIAGEFGGVLASQNNGVAG